MRFLLAAMALCFGLTPVAAIAQAHYEQHTLVQTFEATQSPDSVFRSQSFSLSGFDPSLGELSLVTISFSGEGLVRQDYDAGQNPDFEYLYWARFAYGVGIVRESDGARWVLGSDVQTVFSEIGSGSFSKTFPLYLGFSAVAVESYFPAAPSLYHLEFGVTDYGSVIFYDGDPQPEFPFQDRLVSTQLGFSGFGDLTFFYSTAVPEAPHWAMMIVGLGLIGGLLRHRDRLRPRLSGDRAN